VELGYVGAKGTHLFLPPVNLNPIPFDVSESYVGQGINPLANPINDPLGRLNAAGTAPYQFAPAYLGVKYFGFANVYQSYDSSANSIRHAATVNVRRRPAAGLTLPANYTFGRPSTGVRRRRCALRQPQRPLARPRQFRRDPRTTAPSPPSTSSTPSTSRPLRRAVRARPDAVARRPRFANALVGGWTLSGVTRIKAASDGGGAARRQRPRPGGKRALDPPRRGPGRTAAQSQLGTTAPSATCASRTTIRPRSCGR
jgi:hypothetical protein